jgi:hypothetical protein
MSQTLTRPIVTNIDRDWALEQMPPWFQMGDICTDEFPEIVDDGGWLEDQRGPAENFEKPSWSAFVAEEVEKFERHYNGERKTYANWTYLWRKEWWPKVSPRKRFPKSAPREWHPFFRAGTAEFDRAIELARPEEKVLWLRFGVAQFKPDDKRLKAIGWDK